ncbi:MAG: dephospho-CoA kinase [Pseudomonadota bacterium]
MITLGLTGSIGMGKSAAAVALKRLGVPVHDADACVHRLLGRGGAAVDPIGALFPAALRDGLIDRGILGSLVFGKQEELARLEAVLHPLVRQATRSFLKCQQRHRRALVALDIPLLFETGGEALCDFVIVVTAPRFVQEGRVFSRPGMSPERLEQIRARQIGELEKRRRADFVVSTGLSKGHTYRRLATIVSQVKRPQVYYPPQFYHPMSL